MTLLWNRALGSISLLPSFPTILLFYNSIYFLILLSISNLLILLFGVYFVNSCCQRGKKQVLLKTRQFAAFIPLSNCMYWVWHPFNMVKIVYISNSGNLGQFSVIVPRLPAVSYSRVPSCPYPSDSQKGWIFDELQIRSPRCAANVLGHLLTFGQQSHDGNWNLQM